MPMTTIRPNEMLWPALLRDLRFAFRMLRRSPGFTIVVVLTLALGVGVNAAMFTTINALLLRQLPYPRADRLVQIGEVDKKTDRETQRVSYPDFEDWKKSARSFEHMAAWHVVDLSVVGPVHPEQILAAATSPEFFGVLSCGESEIRRGAASTANSPAGAGARRDTRRVAGLARQPPATAAPAASYVPAACCGTAPTGVATAGWVRESAVRFCGSPQEPPPSRLNVKLTG